MRRVLVALVALAAAVIPTTPAGAAGRFGPGQYQAGPAGGDPTTYRHADPATGAVAIGQVNHRQASAVWCIGDGPRATLLVSQTATEGVDAVSVDYSEAVMSEHPVIDVLVTGSESDWLGHGNAFGPMAAGRGTIRIPLRKAAQAGEVVTVIFGLQVHGGCLGHPTFAGLQGSRVVEGARAVFTSVTIG
ncbi:MAG: hypothetical protein AB1679_16865 [Actinomycetota bacterium]|jgi:hypothetical protein